MRTPSLTLPRSFTLGAVFVGSIACGTSSGPAKSPEATAGTAAGTSNSAPAVDAGAPTTTSALPDHPDSQPSKLAEAQPTPQAGPAAAPAEAHRAEPGRGPKDIRAIVIAHRDEARACYDRALPDHPGIDGDLVIKWTIDPKGKVSQVSLDSSRSQISEPSVSDCIANIIKKIDFAPSPGGYETKAFYPFNFHPHHGHATSSP